jgi:hypothetical protein
VNARTLICVVVLGIGPAACVTATTGVAPTYRQGLIDPEWDPLGRASEPPPRQRQPDRGRALRRCRRLAGRTLGPTPARAEKRLLAACVGRSPADLRVSRKRAPRPLDLVLFDQARPSPAQRTGRLIGVVVALKGDRVAFLYTRGRRARLGVLNAHAPDRRRSAGGTVENTFLRIIRRGDPRGTRYLAGQLLSGFAAPPL